MRRVEVRLLGGFEVLVDSRPVAAEAWAQRRATNLVKLLALASGHRLSRDEVLEMLDARAACGPARAPPRSDALPSPLGGGPPGGARR